MSQLSYAELSRRSENYEESKRKERFEAAETRAREDEYVIEQIESDSEIAHEAIATEATMNIMGNVRRSLKDLYIAAIEADCTSKQAEADEALGQKLRIMAQLYIARGMEDE